MAIKINDILRILHLEFYTKTQIVNSLLNSQSVSLRQHEGSQHSLLTDAGRLLR